MENEDILTQDELVIIGTALRGYVSTLTLTGVDGFTFNSRKNALEAISKIQTKLHLEN